MNAPARIPDRHAELPERQAARRWFALSVGSLIIAGLLSVLLVVARLPPFSGLVGDPSFFKRCLVVHVDLSLVVWFCSFIAGQSFLLSSGKQSSRRSRYGVWVAAAGVLSLLLSAGVPGAEPVLANYVPVVDHWLFGVGLALFGCGVLLAIVDARLLPSAPHVLSGFFELPAAARPGLRAALLALIVAALTFAASYSAPLPGLSPAVTFELLHWGGGHVLQLATSIAMVATWFILLTGLLGRAPISERAAAGLFALMTLPWLSAPLLALHGPQDAWARQAFTELMRFGIFPGVLLALVLCARAVVRSRGAIRGAADPRLTGFVASACLTVLGYALGAMIRGSSTMVPAHYHACIGAVTVAFMTLAFELVEPLGLRLPRGKLAHIVRRYQPLLFGVGQSVFAIGFALAGVHGAGRKTYGAEQHVRSASEAFGLVVMGAGGVLAVAAGVAFLAYLAVAWSAATTTGGAHVRASLSQNPSLATRAR